MATDAWIDVGYVARTHGVRGTLWVHWHDGSPLQPFPEALQLARPHAPAVTCVVVSHRRHKNGTLIDLEGIADMESAQRLKGAAVRVLESSLPQEGSGEVYLYRLMGALCRDAHTQNTLGTLQNIYNHGASMVLGIAPPGGGEEILVPLLDNTLRQRHEAFGSAPQILDLALLPDYFAP